MIKVSVNRVLNPTTFIGTDPILLEKIKQACSLIKNGDSILLPCSDITSHMIVLYNFKDQLIRLRIISETNTNTFKCFLIDHGSIKEVKKQKMFLVPLNQLRMDPAVKLYRISGVIPAVMNDNHKNLPCEPREWSDESFRFVCRVFKEHQSVYVTELKRRTQDVTIVDVFVSYDNTRENFKDLLIRENFASTKNDDQLAVSNLSLSESVDSFLGDSILDFVDKFKDDDKDSIGVISEFVDIVGPCAAFQNYDSLTTNRSTFGTLDEISQQILNNKVKSWLVSRSQTKNDDSVTKYVYKSPVRPILSYQKDLMISSFLKDTMVYHKTKSLLLIQSFMIPSILRGLNVVAIAPPKKGKSMGIVMPILQKIATKAVSKTRSFNPLAIILCTSWKKIKDIADSTKLFLKFIHESNRIRKPKVVSAYAGQMEKKIMITILEGCDILVVTPKCLLRLLKTHEFLRLDELEIMALDDAEKLIAHHLDTIREIFVYKQTGSTESGIQVHQIATATHWTSGLQSFVQNEMGNMFTLTVNNPLEIAVFERLQQKLVEYDKEPDGLYQKLLTHLKTTESSLKRTIIFASDDAQIKSIYKFLMENMSVDLMVMIGSMSGPELNVIEREWNMYRGLINMPLLLISDEALGRSEISIFNAQMILHADVNPSMFGSRINFLRDQFSELSFLQPSIPDNEPFTVYSHVFVCALDLDLSHADFLYKFMGRCNSERPQWLQEKAIDYVLNKERSKVINEICPQIKAKGECKSPACSKRHIVLSDVDKSLLPNRGQIKFRLLHLISPSNFFVRIMEHRVGNETQNGDFKSQYINLKLNIIKHFNEPKNVQGVSQKSIKPGLIAAIRMNDILERVLITKMKSMSNKIAVKLIDHGSTMIVEQLDLLTLPKELLSIPPQAVEVYVTGIRPLDNDEYYHEESCEYTKKFLEGKDLYGVIMLCIGKTLWLDSVTQLVHHKSTNISVFDKNLSVELVEQDFVERNPGHIQRLIRLCTGKIDIWNSASGGEPKKPVAIMRKFTYNDEALQFEDISIQDEDDYTDNECTVLRVVSPELIFLSNRETSESIKQMQKEIKSLIDSIETLPFREVTSGSRVLVFVDTDWVRGYVLSVGSSVLILSLDWGTVVNYVCEDYVLKKLPSEYQALPYHAVMVALRHCRAGSVFSSQTDAVIENFVTSSNKKILMSVCAFDVEDASPHMLVLDCPEVDSMRDLDLFRSLKRYSVTMSKKSPRGDQELFDVLVRQLCVTPAPSWIYMVLPESETPVGELDLCESIAHLGSDIFSTMDPDSRLHLAEIIERRVLTMIGLYEDNHMVPRDVDDLLNTIFVLLHFLEVPPVFMCLYRSLTALLNLAYRVKLPIDDRRSREVFSVLYISNSLYSYQSLLFHVLGHLNMVIRGTRPKDVEVFLAMFKLLLVDTCFVTNLLEEESWAVVMATCVASMHEDEHLYRLLVDILVQLALFANSDKPLLAGVLRQCCRALTTSESPSVWTSSLALISCLVNMKAYYGLLRDLDLFTVLFDRTVAYYDEVRDWTDMHECALEVLSAMWRNASVDRQQVVRRGGLSDALKAISKQVPGNDALGRLLTDVILAESAVVPQQHAPSVTDEVAMPDPDASEWMNAKDKSLLKRHRRSRRKIFPGMTADESDDDKDRLESDSDSSGAEVNAFLNDGHNPADEDNVHCYDRL